MSKRSFFACEEVEKKPRIFWFLIFSFMWSLYILPKADAAQEKVEAELQSSGAIMRWWNNNEPSRARIFVYMWGGVGLYALFIAAHFLAPIHVAIAKRISGKLEDRKAHREQERFELQMHQLDKENQRLATLSRTAQSKKELVIRLGNIDQFIRVLEHESDGGKRIVALQAAQAELNIVDAKLVSGEITQDAVSAPEVLERALETCVELTRLGLKEDRLHRDLLRAFNIRTGEL